MPIPKRKTEAQPDFPQARQDIMHSVPRGAFGEDVHNAFVNLGENVNRIGQILENVERQRIQNDIQKLNKDIIIHKTKLQESLNNGTFSPKDLGSYLQELDLYSNQRGKELLGKEGYDKWTAGQGEQVMFAARADLTNNYALYQNKKNLEDIDTMSNDAANAALADSKNAQKIIAQHSQYIASASLPAADKLKLEKRFQRSYALGLVAKNIQNDPHNTVKALEANDPEYAALTPEEHVRYINAAERAMGAAKGTSHDFNVRQLINFWAAQNEQNPENGNNFLQQAAKTPGEFIETAKKQFAAYGVSLEGLDHKDVITFVNQAQAVINDPDQPNALINNKEFGLFEAKFNSYFTDKNGKITDTITDKKNNNLDFAVGLQNELIGMRNNGRYRTYNKTIDKMINKTDSVLLNMMNEKPKSAFDNDSVSSFVIRRIYKMNDVSGIDVLGVGIVENQKGRPVDTISAKGIKVGKRNRFFDDTTKDAYFINEQVKPLPPEYLARIYGSVYNKLAAEGINPSNIYNDNIDAVERIVDETFTQALIKYYNLPDGDFDAILSQNALIRYSLPTAPKAIKIKGN